MLVIPLYVFFSPPGTTLHVALSCFVPRCEAGVSDLEDEQTLLDDDVDVVAKDGVTDILNPRWISPASFETGCTRYFFGEASGRTETEHGVVWRVHHA